MATAAVAGVLGVASAVSNYNTQKRQADAQQAQLEAAKAAATNDYAISLLNLQQQQAYASYQTQVAQQSRMAQYGQQLSGLTVQELSDQLSSAAANFTTNQQLYGSLLNAEATRQEALRQRAQSTQQALGIREQAKQEATQSLKEATGQTRQLSQAISQEDAKRAALDAMLGATLGNTQGRTTQALQKQAYSSEAEQALAALLNSSQVSADTALQMIYAGKIADLADQLGLINANQLSFNADAASTYAYHQATATSQNVQNTMQANQAARQALQNELGLFMQSAGQTDQFNQAMADTSFGLKKAALGSQYDSAQRGYAAQSSAIQQPSFIPIVTSAVQAVTPFVGKPLSTVWGQQPQSSSISWEKPSTVPSFPTTGGNYSVYGYTPSFLGHM